MLDTAMVYRSGLMEQNMKVIGIIIKPMVKVYSGTYMVTNTKDGGKMDNLMD